MTGRTNAEDMSERRRANIEQLETDLAAKTTAEKTASDNASAERSARSAAESEAAAKDTALTDLQAKVDTLQNPADPLAGPLSEDERR